MSFLDLPFEVFSFLISFLSFRDIIQLAHVSTSSRTATLIAVQTLNDAPCLPLAALLIFPNLRYFHGTIVFSTVKEVEEISRRLRGSISLVLNAYGWYFKSRGASCDFIGSTDDLERHHVPSRFISHEKFQEFGEEDIHTYVPPLIDLLKIRALLYPEAEVLILLDHGVRLSWSPVHTTLLLPCPKERSTKDTQYLSSVLEFISCVPITSLDYTFLPLSMKDRTKDRVSSDLELPILLALSEKPLTSLGDDVCSGGGLGAFRLLGSRYKTQKHGNEDIPLLYPMIDNSHIVRIEDRDSHITKLRILDLFQGHEGDPEWDEDLDPVFFLHKVPSYARKPITEITGDICLDCENDDDEETIEMYPNVTHWTISLSSVDVDEVREYMTEEFPGRTFSFTGY